MVENTAWRLFITPVGHHVPQGKGKSKAKGAAVIETSQRIICLHSLSSPPGYVFGQRLVRNAHSYVMCRCQGMEFVVCGDSGGCITILALVEVRDQLCVDGSCTLGIHSARLLLIVGSNMLCVCACLCACVCVHVYVCVLVCVCLCVYM